MRLALKRHSLSRAMTAGLAATVATALFGLLAGLARMPFLDWGRALSAPVGHTLLGYSLYFALGIAVALIFNGLLHDRLPGESWRRGFLFAVILWIVTGAALAPLLDLGFFMGSVLVALGTLAAYLCYGGILGYLCDV